MLTTTQVSKPSVVFYNSYLGSTLNITLRRIVINYKTINFFILHKLIHTVIESTIVFKCVQKVYTMEPRR